MSIRGTMIAAFLLFFVSSSLQAQSTEFQLSLARKYGFAAYQQCRLDIRVSGIYGWATLQCVPSTKFRPPEPVQKELPPVKFQKELPPADVQSLTELLALSTLFEGVPGSGTDESNEDGIFETLEVHQGLKAVVAVTSGNAAFAAVPARKQLLDLLKAIEKRISS